MAVRDDANEGSAQADIESLERLLKETLLQPLVATQPLHIAHTNPAHETKARADLSRPQALFEVPSLQREGFGISSVPPSPVDLPTPPQQTSQDDSQNGRRINFEAAMAQLSQIIDPASGHKRPNAPASHGTIDNSLHSFFEEEVQHHRPEPSLGKRDDFSGMSFPQRADMRPFAAPAPYSVPDMGVGSHYPAMGSSQKGSPQDHAEGPYATAMRAVQQSANTAQKALDAVEKRLAEEAAKVSLSVNANAKRTYKVFYALAGIAAIGVIGLVGMSLSDGRSKIETAAKSDVPIIAAKSVPTKEKPENPGGIEIPNQNKQVLSPRTQLENKPAQVLNTTEQPVDLTQIARKEPVRVVFPNPNQTTPQEGAGSAAPLEPKRVSSVRLGSSGIETQPPPPSPAPQPQNEVLDLTPRAVYLPPMPAIPVKPVLQAVDAQALSEPKPEARPDLPGPPIARPSSLSSSVVVNNAPSLRTSVNAPLTLTQQSNSTSLPREISSQLDAPLVASASPTGAYAVQLASRPSEASARDALLQLRNRYSGQLGGKSLSVVSGEVNGQTVYRVRAIGYSQAEADVACNQIKATGGGCFVTKQ